MAIVLPLRRVPRLKRKKWRIRQMCSDSKFELQLLRAEGFRSLPLTLSTTLLQNVLNFIDQPVNVTFTFRK